MYKPSTYLVIIYYPNLFTYIWDLFLIELVTKVKLHTNSVEISSTTE